FFSSRRRHTRSDRDWSSDVCSSDLIGGQAVVGGVVDAAERQGGAEVVALGRVVVDDVEDHLDAGLVERPDHRFELGDLTARASRSEEHTSELQSRSDLVCRLLLEKK